MDKFFVVGLLYFTLKNEFMYEPGELTRYYSNIWKVKERKLEIGDRHIFGCLLLFLMKRMFPI